MDTKDYCKKCGKHFDQGCKCHNKVIDGKMVNTRTGKVINTKLRASGWEQPLSIPKRRKP